METKIVKINPDEIDLTKIKEAATIVDNGGLVAFPTETVYGIACRVRNDSLSKLSSLKERTLEKSYSLHIAQKAEVSKYVPTIGLKAEKLIRNVWPGPMTIVLELSEQDLSKQQQNIEREVFQGLYKNGCIGIRCPDNPVASMLLQLTNSPVVAPSANTTGHAPAIDARQVLTQFSGRIETILDGGSCKYGKSSTVVRADKGRIQILRQGTYSEQQLLKLSLVTFLFVCTGNTCRSPMAEGIFRKYLAEKIACKVDQLDNIGYKVISAGTMNTVDSPASKEAIVACAAKGVDIKAHKSQKLSRQLIEQSDLIFAMTSWHCEQVMAVDPNAANKCRLLAEHEDIFDPIGQPQEVFNTCAELIERAIKKRIGELII